MDGNGVFEHALQFAAQAHSGQIRKNGGIYLLHPMEVACIAATMTDDEDVIAAALLHDTVEDTDVTAAEILREFGTRIAALVASETEDKRPGVPPAVSWQVRKEESLAELKESRDLNVKILWLSDKLSNLRAVARTYGEVGDEVFRLFNEPDKEKQRWYFSSVLSLVGELSQTDAYREYKALMQRVFC